MIPIARSTALLLLGAMLALAGCAPKTPKDYTDFKAEAPRSILIVPVANKSTEADAPDNFLATLPVPLAERGYYVFPVNMVKRTMEDDGLSDADMVGAADTVRLAGLFGADAVLYATIEDWNARYIVISETTTVKVQYTLKSGKSGKTLWDRTIVTQYSPQANGGNPLANLIAGAIAAAIERAHPSYLRLARQANTVAFYQEGQGVLSGPYAAPKP
jgi:hypothetical protein